MGRCDVKRDPNAGAYLEAVKGTVCHIPGDYLSKPQHRLSHQETGRESNFLDHSNRLVSSLFWFSLLLSLVSLYYHCYGVLRMWSTSLWAHAVRGCVLGAKAGAGTDSNFFGFETEPWLVCLTCALWIGRDQQRESRWPLFLNSCVGSRHRVPDTKQASFKSFFAGKQSAASVQVPDSLRGD